MKTLLRRLYAWPFLLTLIAFAQGPQGMTPVDDATANAVLQHAAAEFPKFTKAFADEKRDDKLIRQIRFVRAAGPGRGPAFAAPNGVISIDISYLESPRPNFDDNRMVVVLEHEIGHLHYFQLTPRSAWTPDNSEQAAFEYSLKTTKAMAEKGDCGPLQSGLKFMLMRSRGTNLADPHVRALQRMVKEPLYADYVAYAKQHCPAQPEVRSNENVASPQP